MLPYLTNLMDLIRIELRRNEKGRKTMRERWGWAMRPAFGIGILLWLALFYGASPNNAAQGRERLRLGYFPNVTHAPALVGVARGDFQKALGVGIGLEPKAFNAGPEAMEALLAGAMDVSYVGPGPAINTYLKSHGKALRLVAGACSGGASLVARSGSNISSIRDLDGKRVAVPQLGGTQDISLRFFLSRENLQTRDKGGSVEVLPIKSPDTLALMKRGEIDAAWMPEPWVTRLIHEAGATLVVDERNLWPDRQFPTTVVVARTEFLEKHPEQVAAILQAHLSAIRFLQASPAEAQSVVNAKLKELTGKPLPEADLREAWNRVTFTENPDTRSMETFTKMAIKTGYLPENSSIAAMFAPAPLAAAQKWLAAAR